MNPGQELATMMRNILHDRLDNATRESVALEAASLRAFLMSTLYTLDHIDTHLRKGEITTNAELSTLMQHLISKIENSIANLDDVRAELIHQEHKHEA